MDLDGKQKVRHTHQPTKELARRFLAEVKAKVARGLAGIPVVTKENAEQRGVTVSELCKEFGEKYERPCIKDPAGYRMQARCIIRRRIEPYPIARLAVVDVRPRDIETLREALRRGEHHRAERLVDLHEVDVGHRHARCAPAACGWRGSGR